MSDQMSVEEALRILKEEFIDENSRGTPQTHKILHHLGHAESCPWFPNLLGLSKSYPTICDCGLFKHIEYDHNIPLKQFYEHRPTNQAPKQEDPA